MLRESFTVCNSADFNYFKETYGKDFAEVTIKRKLRYLVNEGIISKQNVGGEDFWQVTHKGKMARPNVIVKSEDPQEVLYQGMNMLEYKTFKLFVFSMRSVLKKAYESIDRIYSKLE